MTGRPRVPKAAARITGADIAQPRRFADRNEPKVISLGKAPKRFTDDQAEIWNDFNSDLPWLGRSDRALVETATLLMDQIRNSDKLLVGAVGQMRLLLSSLGGTPVDRSQVFQPDDTVDPADKYFQ